MLVGEASVAGEAEPVADGTAAVVHETAAIRIATKAKRTPVPRARGYTATVDLSGGPLAQISSDTASRLRDDGIGLRALGEAHVKGKAQAIEVFTLS